MENYKKVDEHGATVCDCPARVHTVTFDQQGTSVMMSQTYFIKDNIAYVITYGATPKSHAQYYDCFECVINSFKFE